MQGLDPRMPFGIQAIMALVKKELVAHNKPNIQVSIAIYPHLLLVENLSPFLYINIQIVLFSLFFVSKQDGSQVPG